MISDSTDDKLAIENEVDKIVQNELSPFKIKEGEAHNEYLVDIDRLESIINRVIKQVVGELSALKQMQLIWVQERLKEVLALEGNSNLLSFEY